MDSTGCGGCSWCWVSSHLLNLDKSNKESNGFALFVTQLSSVEVKCSSVEVSCAVNMLQNSYSGIIKLNYQYIYPVIAT